jgi:hypothetical protein
MNLPRDPFAPDREVDPDNLPTFWVVRRSFDRWYPVGTVVAQTGGDERYPLRVGIVSRSTPLGQGLVQGANLADLCLATPAAIRLALTRPHPHPEGKPTLPELSQLNKILGSHWVRSANVMFHGTLMTHDQLLVVRQQLLQRQRELDRWWGWARLARRQRQAINEGLDRLARSRPASRRA